MSERKCLTRKSDTEQQQRKEIVKRIGNPQYERRRKWHLRGAFNYFPDFFVQAFKIAVDS